MATKKGTYKIDNGSGYDEIMFKTTAEQVVESTTKRFVSDTEKGDWNDARVKALDWNSFKTSGGKIGGHVQLNKGNSFVIDGVGWIGTGSATEFEMIQTNKGKVVRVGTTDNLGNHLFMGLDGNDGVFGPSHNNLINLGKSTNAFKDLWLGSYSKSTNGYTKLTNGLILQWGKLYRTGDEARSFEIYPSFPIAFPNECLTFVCTVGAEDQFTNPRDMMYYSVALHNIQYKVRGSSVGEYAHTVERVHIQWFAIGY